jgi:NlpC/P60 family putative phage cell wall peptidase
LAEAARAAMIELDVAEACTGDVILFRMRAGAIAKHVGILSGTDSRARSHFIHAYERTGVIEEHLTPAWQRRIAFAFRFPER